MMVVKEEIIPSIIENFPLGPISSGIERDQKSEKKLIRGDERIKKKMCSSHK